MRFKKTLFVLATIVVAAGVSVAQDKSLGAIKGKVRVETGTPADVTVVVRQGETEVTRSTTNKNGEFLVSRLTPGLYGLTFRKTGLSIGSIEDVEVKAGKTRSLGDRLILTIDEGSIAFLSGSVFNAAGKACRVPKLSWRGYSKTGRLRRSTGVSRRRPDRSSFGCLRSRGSIA